ncbi:MAG: TIGR02757 family protein [Vicinamibacterales bacterium]
MANGSRRSAPAASVVGFKPVLDDLVRSFECATHVADPVRVLVRYPDLADRELAAFVAAGLAFGRVQSVINSVEAVLAVLGPHPARWVTRFDAARDGHRLQPIVHRWTRGDDLIALLAVLRDILRRAGSLEGFFSEGLAPDAVDVREAIESFSTRACALLPRGTDARTIRGVRYFFARPSAGSACKRLNLFLRWMVRHDAIDPGGWTRVRPAQLVVPLDVHVIRVGRCLGLTRRKSPGWEMAADITEGLRRIDAADPVKYDFALCHLGMLGQCHYGRPESPAGPCPLSGFCRPRRRS